LRSPWEKPDRSQIIEATKECLGITDAMMPVIRERVISETEYDGYSVRRLLYESWDHFYGTASLYVPRGGGSRPCVVVCCGHGREGKLTPGYQAMGRRIARQGAYALINDNIGQGEREPMGHRDCVAPFYCGTSVQGLIVLETLAWINRLAEYPQIDEAKIGACGNSGGGTLTLFLAALCDRLAALNSSGYPSAFWWLAAKEKRHCHCNIIPHALSRIEMWELYSVFAPRPLFLMHGTLDNLLPVDLFYQNARCVLDTYRQLGAQDELTAEVFPGTHSWDSRRRHALGDFFMRTLGISPAEELTDDEIDTIDPASATCVFPDDAISTDELAQRLTGVRAPEGLRLSDVFRPRLSGELLHAHELQERIERGEVMQILAQYEAFL
ncbi:MAG: hypothetical protein GX549_07190, partial [Clostridiales bacterium]|nr:hypothetical protein [Clostridiales bacterium]